MAGITAARFNVVRGGALAMLVGVVVSVVSTVGWAKTVQFQFVLPTASAQPADWAGMDAQIRLDAPPSKDFRGPWLQRIGTLSPKLTFDYEMPVPGAVEVVVKPGKGFPYQGRARVEVTKDLFEAAGTVKADVALSPFTERDLAVQLLDSRNDRPIAGQLIQMTEGNEARVLGGATTNDAGVAHFKVSLEGAIHIALVPTVGRDSIYQLTEEDKKKGSLVWRIIPPIQVLKGEVVILKADATREPWPEELRPPLLLRDEKGKTFMVGSGPGGKLRAYAAQLPAGSYDWMIDEGGGGQFELVEPKTVVIPASAPLIEQTVVLRRRPLGTLTVCLPKPPKGGKPWTVAFVGQGYRQSISVSDVQGQLLLKDVPQGEFLISAKSPDFREIVRQKVEVTGGEQQLVLDAAPCLTYTVKVTQGSKPVPRASVVLLQAQGDAVKHYRGEPVLNEGEFVVGELDKGRYELTVRVHGGVTQFVGQVEIKESVTQLVEIPLGTPCHGRVLGIENLPSPAAGDIKGIWPPQVAILLETPDGLSEGIGAGNCTVEGEKWEFSLAPGVYRVYLLARKNGYLAGRLTVKGGALEQDFAITPELLAHPIAIEEIDKLENAPRKLPSPTEKK